MTIELANRLIATLPSGVPGLFNPWKDYCADDEPWNDPYEKTKRLAAHLACTPKIILCGEAPGHLGCRHSGIAFTSERLLIEGVIPRIGNPGARLTKRHLPFSEPSATIVWKALYRLGLQDHVILWNALQMHPYKGVNHRTNRTPSIDEIAMGEPALRILTHSYPNAAVVAVGKKAEGLLKSMEIIPAATIRHPANGGANEFSSGLENYVNSLETGVQCE